MSSEELKILTAKRKSIRQRQTHFKNYLESLVKLIQESTILKVNKAKFIELETRLEKQELLLTEFQEVQISIELLHETPEKQYEERETFENGYFAVLSLGKQILFDYDQTLIKQNVSGSKNEGNNSQDGSVAPGSVTSMSAPIQNIRLPQIQLPKFTGSYENWLEFRDTFDSLINSNGSINEIQKFHYLRAALEGGAAQIIRSLEFSSANYAVAWDALLNRYNNDNLLVHNHVKAIFNLPNLTQESANELRKMIDIVCKHLRSLKTLEQPTEHWDTLLIYLLSNKLDQTTARQWEEQKVKDKNKLPTLEDFQTFIKHKADLLETLALAKDVRVTKPRQTNVSYNSNTSDPTASVCIVCKESHFIQNCPEFLKLSINDRIETSRKLKLCMNCLRGNHISKNCYAGPCRRCHSKHNTLLHFENKSVSANTAETNTNSKSNDATAASLAANVQSNENQTVNFSSNNSYSDSNVLLSTALIQVKDNLGRTHTCRALLDSASQSHFITTELCERLGLQKSKISMSVVGISQATANISHKCNLNIESLHNSFNTTVSCLVLNKINENMPMQQVDVSLLNIPKHLKLADPEFNKSSKIDVLLGAGIFYNLLCIGQVRLGVNLPTLQKTLFGWVISGPIKSNSLSSKVQCSLSTNLQIQDQLSKFWEIEESYSEIPTLSEDEKICEEIFAKTTKRDQEGRFIVQIPFKQSPSCLGESQSYAIKRFHSLESKLSKNDTLKQLYVEFMDEYSKLGHMSNVSKGSDPNSTSFYFPHHGVLNEKNQTTKLRVVFDGSSRTNSGISLNDIQYIGPSIQDDLMSIILRFRLHNVVVCADIVKMYRQILVDPNQTSLQKILWRSDPTDELQTYQLRTVTYGTASAPWLAVRCLKQLSQENSELFSRSSNIISRDFYMDDLLTGAETEEEAIQLCDEISSILKTGCFELQKWASNSSKVLQHVKNLNPSTILKLGEGEKTKTLGLYWSASSDCLMYSISDYSESRSITKRSVLSDISQIFDPLGLLGPCIIIAKVILQKLWLYKLSWDESLPSDLDNKWRNFRQQLSALNSLQIPRLVLGSDIIKKEIHGFADAALESYGSCIYIRTVSKSGHIQVRLLCSKTKVAPLKTLTIPRLELCAALMLAKLIHKVKTALGIEFDETFLWTDSTVCLSWIRTQPNILQTFVGNRVSQIQSLTNPSVWCHVQSQFNPADYLSRGVNPEKIGNCVMWWQGPDWLSQPQDSWSKSHFQMLEHVPEVKKKFITCQVMQHQKVFAFERFSNLNRLRRTIAYCRRFISNCKSREERLTGPLTSLELEEAMSCLVRMSQTESFPDELQLLQKNQNLKTKSCFSGLNPFIDEQGIIRVGGRLNLSDLPYEQKYPILLAAKHALTSLIFSFEHVKLLHAGPQLLLYTVRERYWPLGGRNLARKTVRSCVRCFRTKPITKNPIMGLLPKSRVCPAPAFNTTGIDYAGPFLLKDKKGRGGKSTKCYIALFICFTTKCIHLELVSDLTTEGFIAAFRRFTSRRGKPQNVYSDNGTNFVGAHNELTELANFLKQNENNLQETICNQGVNWHFIPAFSPHFGGIWEAGVKSCKTHLKRVMANAKLTFEEFYTILTEIEAVLNSRPITSMSSDPNDFSALTPSHFLIGRPMTALPDPDLTEIPVNRLSRFQLLQQIQQHFWSRWCREYVSELQLRSKWKTNDHSLEVGALVVIKDDHLPPLRWQLGRVMTTHAGPDGIARVALIKTPSGVIKRSFSKLCPLPLEDGTASE